MVETEDYGKILSGGAREGKTSFQPPLAFSVMRSLRWIALLSVLLTQVHCNWKGRGGPSTLVIAVEGLAFESVTCEAEDFRALCEDGVRFTHAYSTSTLSQPGLASLLTGLYPLEHGVHNNGKNAIAAHLTTVAEAAVAGGARTALFSGGPPILRKSGLSQGFETFDDHFSLNLARLFRPASETIQAFLSWLEREVERAPFFAVIYLADLQFPESATVSDLGEVRDRSPDAQLKEVAESLGGLFRELKSQGLWHRTHVILVGLNGLKTIHPGELQPLSVYADNTQVALFLKPARRSQDLGPQWTVDKNVSLADVGLSLFEFVRSSTAPAPLEALPRVSLFRLVNQPQADWNDDRLILIESGWGEWRGLSNIRYAARRRQYLYVHDQKPKIFNTLLDRLEANPLPSGDPLWIALRPVLMAFFEQHRLPGFAMTDELLSQRLTGAMQWWADRAQRSHAESNGLWTADPQLGRWRAERAVQQSDWEGLAKVAEQAKDPLTLYVAKQNQGIMARLPLGNCARFFQLQSKMSSRENGPCSDEMLTHLAEWAGGDDEERRERSFETFIGLFRAQKMLNEMGAANYVRLLPWDVALSHPYGLSLADLYLALPDRRPLAETVRARLSREDKALDL